MTDGLESINQRMKRKEGTKEGKSKQTTSPFSVLDLEKRFLQTYDTLTGFFLTLFLPYNDEESPFRSRVIVIVIVSMSMLNLSHTLSSLARVQREFRFVPYGTSAPDEGRHNSITCDGRVPGAMLEVTHALDGE
jgi:hypothetical protein